MAGQGRRGGCGAPGGRPRKRRAQRRPPVVAMGAMTLGEHALFGQARRRNEGGSNGGGALMQHSERTAYASCLLSSVSDHCAGRWFCGGCHTGWRRTGKVDQASNKGHALRTFPGTNVHASAKLRSFDSSPPPCGGQQAEASTARFHRRRGGRHPFWQRSRARRRSGIYARSPEGRSRARPGTLAGSAVLDYRSQTRAAGSIE